ncbi:MAG: hypothetical protein CL917_14360 [Deltaproteobacteria bacterium]|nr:hypothetical protein [Deltaproteobacteria bacterium]
MVQFIRVHFRILFEGGIRIYVFKKQSLILASTQTPTIFFRPLNRKPPPFYTIKEHSPEIVWNPYSEAFVEKETRAYASSLTCSTKICRISEIEMSKIRRKGKEGNHENLAGHRLGK